MSKKTYPLIIHIGIFGPVPQDRKALPPVTKKSYYLWEAISILLFIFGISRNGAHRQTPSAVGEQA
jgi:hypothetical protein